MKKIIYIGEADGSAIYYDTKNNTPLKAPKSKLLNTRKSQNNFRYITLILVGLFLIKSLGILIPSIDPFTGKYTVATLVFLIALWLTEFVIFTILVYRALYKNIRQATFSNSKEFGYAIKNNNFWNIFKNKKVTFGKKFGMFILITVFVCLTIGIFPMVNIINAQDQFFGKTIGSEIIGISFLGVMPFVCVLFLWLNNPLRWLNIVEKYQKKKIIYDMGN